MRGRTDEFDCAVRLLLFIHENHAIESVVLREPGKEGTAGSHEHEAPAAARASRCSSKRATCRENSQP